MAHATNAYADADVIVCGFGVADQLQLTIESQRAIQSSGHTFAVSPPPNLAKYLRASRIRVVDLTDHMNTRSTYAEAYVDVVDIVLRRAATDPPAVLCVPGSPLFFDTLTRFVIETAAELELSVVVLPGVSLVDAVVTALGPDVTTRGLQIFDARHLVGARQAINVDVPLLVTGVDALTDPKLLPSGTCSEAVIGALGSYVARSHTTDPLVTLVNTDGRSPPISVRLSRVAELAGLVRSGATFFIDRQTGKQ